MKTMSDNSLSAYSVQPKEVLDLNSKRIGMGSEVPWRMSRLGIEEAKGAQDTFVLWWQIESHM